MKKIICKNNYGTLLTTVTNHCAWVITVKLAAPSLLSNIPLWTPTIFVREHGVHAGPKDYFVVVVVVVVVVVIRGSI
jgi:hypothetical protein